MAGIKHVSFAISEDLWEDIDEIKDERGLSWAEFAERAAEELAVESGESEETEE